MKFPMSNVQFPISKGFTPVRGLINARRGFTLIELLIVLALFGLATSLITASYVSFERNQRVKTAALTLKNDIRLAQNYGSTGYKGTGGDVCANTLEGWYVKASVGSSSYTLSGVCYVTSLATTTPFSSKTVNLPQGVTINSIDLCPTSCSITSGDVYILFETVTNKVYFYNSASTSTPDFSVHNSLYTQSNIKLTGSQGNFYKVFVEGQSGNVYESKQ